MTGEPGGVNVNLITWAVTLVVIARFLFRELRERTLKVRTLWIRPGLIVVFAAAFAVLAVTRPGVNPGFLALVILVSAAVGMLAGVLVVRSTSFAPAGEPRAVRARGSMVTVIVWIAALGLRLAARYLVGGTSADMTTQFELNAGLLALLAGAFVFIALAFHRAIDRLAPGATVSRPL